MPGLGSVVLHFTSLAFSGILGICGDNDLPDGVSCHRIRSQREAHALNDAPAAPSGASDTSDVRSAVKMSALTAVSRVTGFLRTSGQSYALGATALASTYSVANNLPNQLYELVIGGMLVTAFLPVYVSARSRGGSSLSHRYASALTGWVLLLMGIVAAVSMAFASQVVWTQSFSAGSGFDRDLTAWFFRFFACDMLLYSLSSVLSGVLNAEHEYAAPAAAPIANNVVSCLSFSLYAALVGIDRDAALLCLAIGNPLGVLAQASVCVPALRRAGIRIRPTLRGCAPELRETVRLGVPALAVMGVSFATASFQQSGALSVTPSGASVAYYARLWYTLPYALFAVPVMTTAFTRLSERWSDGDEEGFRGGISSSMGALAFLMCMMACLLVAFADMLVGCLGLSGEAGEATAWYLRGLAIALPAYAWCIFFQKAFSACRMVRWYTVASVVGGAVQCVMCVTLTRSWGLAAVSLSTLAYFGFADAVSIAMLRSRFGRLGLRKVAGSSIKGCALGLAGGLCGWLVANVIWNAIGRGIMGSLVACTVGGCVSVGAILALMMAMRVPEAERVLAAIRRKRSVKQ